MRKEDAITSLNLFIEKADRLAVSNFVKNTIGGSGVNLTWSVGKPATVTRAGPDRENIDAFVLTFRFFIQDNERISLHKFSDVFHSPFVQPDETADFDSVRTQINAFLDSATMFDLGGRISRREMMDVFIYGGLSHANPQKKARYDGWMADSLLAPFMQNEFVVILFEVLNAIVYIKNRSDIVLRRIQT
jgi:hypothetical protein